MAIPHHRSRANAYRGSTREGGVSRNGGVNPNAIVQVRLSGPTLAEVDGRHLLGSQGGIVTVTCTGMVDNTTRTLTIVADDAAQLTLHTGINIPPSASSDLMPFSVTGKIARTESAALIGPDGRADNPSNSDASWNISYQLSGSGYGNWTSPKSAPTPIDFPAFELPPPEGPSTVTVTGAQFTLRGGVHVADETVPGTVQSVNLFVFDADEPVPNRLVDLIFDVPVPADAFPGALIPYETTMRLFKNNSGHVAGQDGSSTEPEAEVYQGFEPEGTKPISKTLTVQVSP
jgi:hypothetical protein